MCSIRLLISWEIWMFFLPFIISCGTQTEVPEDQEIAVSTSDTTTVRVTKVRKEVYYDIIPTRGKVRSVRNAGLFFVQQGVVGDVYVENAQRVQKGQLLASLESEKYSVEIKEAKINVERAELEYLNQLAGAGDSTGHGANWPRIKRNLELISGLASARVVLEKMLLAEQQAHLHAPFSGQLSGWKLKAGNKISPNELVGTLIDDQRWMVEAQLMEYNLSGVSVGHPVELRSLVNPNERWIGSVSEIDPMMTSDGFVNVKIQSDDLQGVLDGQSVSVVFKVSKGQHLQVPKSALVRKSDRWVAFTEESGQAKWNYVTPGEDNGQFVTIVEGLSEGQSVIVSGNVQLAHDSPVRREKAGED
jgi:RND family efflux transporter MFP subunit